MAFESEIDQLPHPPLFKVFPQGQPLSITTPQMWPRRSDLAKMSVSAGSPRNRIFLTISSSRL